VHPFDLGHLAHQLEEGVGRAEAHHPLDSRPAVPGAVAEDHLARGGRVLDVALEEPLDHPGLARGGRRHHPRRPRIEMFQEPLVRAALAGRIATLE
jgi:hypothetical protein